MRSNFAKVLFETLSLAPWSITGQFPRKGESIACSAVNSRGTREVSRLKHCLDIVTIVIQLRWRGSRFAVRVKRASRILQLGVASFCPSSVYSAPCFFSRIGARTKKRNKSRIVRVRWSRLVTYGHHRFRSCRKVVKMGKAVRREVASWEPHCG